MSKTAMFERLFVIALLLTFILSMYSLATDSNFRENMSEYMSKMFDHGPDCPGCL